jgi:hypothetical protein
VLLPSNVIVTNVSQLEDQVNTYSVVHKLEIVSDTCALTAEYPDYPEISLMGLTEIVYPNPCSTTFMISQASLGASAYTNYSVVDPTGRIHLEGHLNRDHTMVSVEHLCAGLYLVNLTSSTTQKIKTHKLIVR